MRHFLLLGLIALPLLAQNKRVFIITDAEGVAGVCRQEQTDPKDPELRQLLTGEINAAVEGFLMEAQARFSYGMDTMEAKPFPH